MIAGNCDQARQLVLIFGGPGPEHEVGLASALSVREHLTRRGWTLLEAGVTKDGRWLVGTGALQMLLGTADPMRLPRAWTRPPRDLPWAWTRLQCAASAGHPRQRSLLAIAWLSWLVTGNGGKRAAHTGCSTPAD